MARRPPSSNGYSTNRHPGAYAFVLHKLCEQEAHQAMALSGHDYLLLETDEKLEAWGDAFAECKAALMAERNGTPLRVRSHMLPPNLPTPFENWPRRGPQRSFIVTPNDEIRLVSIELRTA